MTAASAYERPTLKSSWEAVVAHAPTIALVWLTSALLSVAGAIAAWSITHLGALTGSGGGSDTARSLVTAVSEAGQLPFAILSSLVGVLFVAVPAMHYSTGTTITAKAAFSELLRRPTRYLMAGLLFSVVTAVGFLACIVPGILVALVMPIYANRIFLTNQPIGDVFAASFRAVYRSPNGINYLMIEILAWLIVVVVSICTCGLGALLAVPVSSFYLQNAAYHKGLIS